MGGSGRPASEPSPHLSEWCARRFLFRQVLSGTPYGGGQECGAPKRDNAAFMGNREQNMAFERR